MESGSARRVRRDGRRRGEPLLPPESVNWEYFEPSDHHTTCSWKGEASYYDVVVEGERNSDAAWVYPEPKPAASKIAGRLAFWHGVRVEKVSRDVGGSGGLLSRLRHGPAG